MLRHLPAWAYWLAYGVAVTALAVVAWKRVGEWDRANEEKLHRRNRHP